MHKVSRLYENFKPTHYTLTLDLHRQERRFEGEVVIDGELTHGDVIELHAKDLAIDKVMIGNTSASFTLEADDTLRIVPAAPHDDTVALSVKFHGTITDAMHGVYPCYYEHEGQQKELLATQLESHHARELFPCVDEPEAKATYDITLRTEQDVTVLGNMPIKSQRAKDTRLETIFETSPRMSSYLVAFVVGELQQKSSSTKDGVQVSAWATKAQPAESLDFALDVAVRSIEFFNDYFGVPYPLPKADHVAIPDFSSGAMENWGLITYREICMLADSTTAISSREYIATVIAHETSHQWFGNLVTMKWWDDLWLNESFATLMEYICVDALFPEWNIWMNFATQDVLAAMRRDNLPGVQAVKTVVNHPDEISTLFDAAIVYAKGARTLAMCRAYVSEQAFRQGLSEYFRRHQYGNTAGADLWEALSGASSKPVADFMKPWLEQPNYPRVHVSEDDHELTFDQSPFVIPAAKGNSTSLWPIILNGSDNATLLSEAQTTLARPGGMVHFNKGATVHAVFHYDTDLLAELLANVAELTPIDRLNLLHDCSLLTRAGHMDAIQLLNAVRAYHAEESQPVWDIISLCIADLRRLIEPSDEANDQLKRVVSQLVSPLFSRLGWHSKDDEEETDTKLRSTLAGLLGYAEDKLVVNSALSDYRSAADISELPGEIRPVIFSIVTKHGAEEDVDRLMRQYEDTSNSELQNDIAAGLTATKDPRLIAQLLDNLTNKDIVRTQDVARWFAWLMRNRHARDATWQWLQDNWLWIEETFGGDKSYDDYARYSAHALGTDEWLNRYRAFFESKKSVPALKRAIELGEADISIRAAWDARDREALIRALIQSQ